MDKLPKRTEINTNYAWHLEDIYSNIEKWEKDFAISQKSIAYLSDFFGKISTSAQTLLDCLNQSNTTSLMIEKLYVYAFMHFHEDSTNTKNFLLEQKILLYNTLLQLLLLYLKYSLYQNKHLVISENNYPNLKYTITFLKTYFAKKSILYPLNKNNFLLKQAKSQMLLKIYLLC